MARREGQFLVEDFYLNDGGLNTADSPFVVDIRQATGGKNFDYVRRGGVAKRGGHSQLNTSANSQLRSLGLLLWNKPTVARELIRAAGTKIQNFDLDTNTTSNLTEDTTAAGSNFLPGNDTQPVVGSMFNNTNAGVLWLTGGGMTSVYGVYSDAKVTKNGVPAPTASSFTGTPGGSGNTIPVGDYIYTLVYRKLSTQALSNAGTETAAVTVTSGQKVDLAWTLTNNDTTKYDKIYIYRSSAGGTSGFTAGTLVAIVNSSATTYSDTGAVEATSQNVPRAGSAVLDNSELPSGTYKVNTVWKNRLVVAKGSTVYLSNLNNSDSFPTLNRITIPSGGDITALGIVSFNTTSATSVDEFLCVFKQTELWIITGTTIDDWELKFVARTGCQSQPLLVSADGHLFWVNYRGIYFWDGSGKPICVSRTIRDKFYKDGDIDKSKLGIGWGVYLEERQEIQWCLSSKLEGEQKYIIKLDLERTMQSEMTLLDQRQIAGVFTPDVLQFPAYAGVALIRSLDAAEEAFYLGDASGYLYSGYTGFGDAGNNITFEYLTPHLILGSATTGKTVHQVVAKVLRVSNFDLKLDYWSNFRFQETDYDSRQERVQTDSANDELVWDDGNWDETNWASDGILGQTVNVVFNLSPGVNNSNTGESFRFRFSQTGNSETVILYGFSVYYTEND